MLLIDFVDGNFLKNLKMHFKNNLKLIPVCILSRIWYHLIKNYKILRKWTLTFVVLLQQARSRDLPSYTSSSLPPLTDGDGGGRDSLTSGASTIIQEKCCSRMTWRGLNKNMIWCVKLFSFLKSRIRNSERNMLNIKK